MTGWLLDPLRLRRRHGWTPLRVTLVHLVALAGPVAVTLAERGSLQIAVMLTTLATLLLWELAFNLIRARPITFHAASAGLILAVLVPVEIPLWQVALAASFGVVFGELVFGGRGYGIVSVAAASAGFFVFSFSGSELSAGSDLLALATLPVALVLLFGGLLSWRVLVPAIAVLAVAGFLSDGANGSAAMVTTAIFGLTFLVGDPVSAASTQHGRWAFGAMAGGLMVLFNTNAGPEIAPAAVVFASLLASLFAPLIDHMAVAIIIRRRRIRHG